MDEPHGQRRCSTSFSIRRRSRELEKRNLWPASEPELWDPTFAAEAAIDVEPHVALTMHPTASPEATTLDPHEFAQERKLRLSAMSVACQHQVDSELCRSRCQSWKMM
jgi:hypothetical protein